MDPSIRTGRLLTGADFDIESFRLDRNGNYWFGDEFGPYLVKTDAPAPCCAARSRCPASMPRSTRTWWPASRRPTCRVPADSRAWRSTSSGTKLYTLLERTVTGDADKTLRIDEFDIDTETYTGRRFIYPVDANGTNIGDMVAVDDRRFVVLERNGGTVTTPSPAPFKKVYLIDIEDVDAGGVARKLELVDLMNLADPHDLNGDGSKVFTFPYVTIENMLILDPRTLLVVNDNNFPYGGGRAAGLGQHRVPADPPAGVAAVRQAGGRPRRARRPRLTGREHPIKNGARRRRFHCNSASLGSGLASATHDREAGDAQGQQGHGARLGDFVRRTRTADRSEHLDVIVAVVEARGG